VLDVAHGGGEAAGAMRRVGSARAGVLMDACVGRQGIVVLALCMRPARETRRAHGSRFCQAGETARRARRPERGLWLVACGLWLVACGLWLVLWLVTATMGPSQTSASIHPHHVRIRSASEPRAYTPGAAVWALSCRLKSCLLEAYEPVSGLPQCPAWSAAEASSRVSPTAQRLPPWRLWCHGPFSLFFYYRCVHVPTACLLSIECTCPYSLPACAPNAPAPIACLPLTY
jgi:hypothetical protein